MARLIAAVACFAAGAVAQAPGGPGAILPIQCGESVTGTTVGGPNLPPDVALGPTAAYQLEIETIGSTGPTQIRASLCEPGSTTNFDTVLSLFSGVDPIVDNLILENDDSFECDNYESKFTTEPLATGVYTIVVSGYSETEAGNFSLLVECGDFPMPDPVEPPVGTGNGSCENNCGDYAEGNATIEGCFCDELCAAFGDCCADMAQFCPNIVPVDPDFPPEPMPTDPMPTEPVALLASRAKKLRKFRS